MQIIIYSLLNFINCAIKQDTNYNIAKCLLLHIDKIEHLSLEESADLCHVSVSTLNRFCRVLGYQNYSTLRYFLMIKEDKAYLYETNDREQDNYEFLHKMHENMLAIEQLPQKHFIETAHFIHTSNRVILLGFGEFQFPALHFQRQMLSFGKLVEISGQINKLNIQLGVNENDLIIITSVLGGFIKAYQKEVKKLTCKKVLLTMVEDQSILCDYDGHILLGVYDDERLRKYSIQRVYEKILLQYYQMYHPTLRG